MGCWNEPEHSDNRVKRFLPIHLSKSLMFTDKNFEGKKNGVSVGGDVQGHIVSCINQNGFLLSRVPLQWTVFLGTQEDVGRMDDQEVAGNR